MWLMTGMASGRKKTAPILLRKECYEEEVQSHITREQGPAKVLVTLDRTLRYKQHRHNTKMKVATHNNLLQKLANSKWGTSASTIRTTALALCYSVAEYAAPVWVRSHHAHVLDSEPNTACRAITGFLKPTNVEDMYMLVGMYVLEWRRKKQESNVAYSLYGQKPTQSRLQSRSCFLSSVRPADFHPNVIRCNEWQHRLNTNT